MHEVLRFKNNEIPLLLGFCAHEGVGRQPFLKICTNAGYSYEGFDVAFFDKTRAAIELYPFGNVFLSTAKNLKPSDKVVTRITTPFQAFPEQAYLTFRRESLGRQPAALKGALRRPQP